MKKIIMFTIAFTFLLVGNAFAADKVETKVKDDKKVEKTLTSEDVAREKEAKMHEEMGTCLRSDKSMEECHEAMMKSKEKMMAPEGRANRAKMHEEMASCLRSNKSAENCNKAMMKSCEEMKGEKGCFGMSSGMRGRMYKKMNK